MDSVTSASTRYPVSYAEIGYAFSYAHHRSRTAVAERYRLVKTGTNEIDCREDAVPLCFAPNLANQIGTRFGFLEEVLSGKFRGGALRSR